jgi:ESCRT-II complex subunit VPS25
MQSAIPVYSETVSTATGDTPSSGQDSTAVPLPRSNGHSATTTTSSTTSPPFAFPREYSFPPFFTRQTNALTFHAQCHKWSALILAYCRAHRLWKLSLVDALDSDLFWNQRIRKRLAMADARELLDYMRRDGRADWVGGPDGGRNVAWIWWRNPEEWAGAIADWVSGFRSCRPFPTPVGRERRQSANFGAAG